MKKVFVIFSLFVSLFVTPSAVFAQEGPVCNQPCRTDDQCQDGTSLYFCSQVGLWPWRRMCRLKASPKSDVCQPEPTPTPVVTSTPIPTSSPTGSPQPTSTATPTPSASPTSDVVCKGFRITQGNYGKAPAKVDFEADTTGSGNYSHIYYFGDGQKTEQTGKTVSHTYQNSGTFYARVIVKDAKGKEVSSQSCETQVVINPNTVESQRSGCSALYIESGNYHMAPNVVKLRVDGYDNKGNIQRYKIEYGDGEVEERTDRNFQHTYQKAGTYTAKAYIQDSQGNWKGGESDCRQTVHSGTGKIDKQPDTGIPFPMLVTMVSTGLAGGSLEIFRRTRKA